MWASLKYSHTVSSDYFGIGQNFERAIPLTYRPKGRNTGYLDLSANYPLIDKLTLNGHVGYTRYASDLRDVPGGVPNYYDYKLGVTYDLGSGFSVAGAVVGANKKNYYGDINKTRAIFTISKSM
jgi:Outer membrane protein V